jgi:hypothetical protein
MRARQAAALNGCRRLCNEMNDLDWMDDPSYRTFLGVVSESDHLPIGPDRKHWNPEALKRKDAEIERVANHYRPYVLKACEQLLAKYQVKDSQN